MLVSVWGKRWCEVELVMLTLYIDDSGTDPKQPVAIATALIIPALQIARLESEWDTLKEKEGFSEFHTSVFVARNPDSEFSDWPDEKQDRVFARVRQISKKYGVRAVSIAVNKKDYDELVPLEFRNYVGKHHYTWAVRQLLSYIAKFSPAGAAPQEWVFQWMGGPSDKRRKEIENLMEQIQWIADKCQVPADYTNYSFRKSKEIPGLQCVDAISWVCHRKARFLFNKTPIHKFAEIGWREFEGHQGEAGWMIAVTVVRPKLQKAIQNTLLDGTAMRLFAEYEEYRKARG